MNKSMKTRNINISESKLCCKKNVTNTVLFNAMQIRFLIFFFFSLLDSNCPRLFFTQKMSHPKIFRDSALYKVKSALVSTLYCIVLTLDLILCSTDK